MAYFVGQDPTVRAAVAARLSQEIIERANVQQLTTQLADKLVEQGAPGQVTDLVPPVVSGISSFLNGRINALMATEEFEEAWSAANRAAHQGLVTVLTGGQGQVITSEGNTVTVDLGQLMSLVKQKLVAEGLTIFGKIPDVSIPYTLVESDQLPKVRTYATLLNTAALWLPWIALTLLLVGVIVAPNRRRAIILASALTGVFAALALFAVTAARTYYVDNLPAEVRSPEAASIVVNTMLRFLIASLQTLVVASIVFIIGGLLAGPSAPAVWLRRVINRGLDAGAGALRRAGTWVSATGRALGAAYHPVRVILVLLAVAAFIAAARPGVPAVLWGSLFVVVLLALFEVFVRAARGGPGAGASPGTPAVAG